MKSVSLTAFSRSALKRLAVKKLRAQGRVPAIIYGRNKPQLLEINTKDIETIIKRSVSEILLLDLAVDGTNRLALVKEIQHHPMKNTILHVDLHEVAEGDKVTVDIPVEAVGEAVGVKTGGGVLEHVLFKMKVRATPKDLPEVINVDVSALEVGKSIHLGDIKLPPGVEALGKKDVSVFAVAAPVAEVVDAAATPAEGGAEVEMIKEKKEDGKAPAAPKKEEKKK